MAISGTTQWIAKGVLQTTWTGLEIDSSATGTVDTGTPVNAYPGMNVMSVFVTGSMASDVVLQFQESMAASLDFVAGNTVCGSPLAFDAATAGALSTGTVYLMRPGARVFRPRITAGASAAESLSVIYIQSK